METIKCEKCGCVMEIASEVCPECGASVRQEEPKVEPQQAHEAPTKEPQQAGVRAPFKGLEEELRNNLALQKKNPSRMVTTYVDHFIKDEEGKQRDILYDYLEVAAANITNCVFKHEDGEEVFAGTLNDGKGHLMMQFILLDHEDAYKRFQALECAKLFTVEKSSNGLYYYSVDCGEDVHLAAEIFTKVAMDVYELPATVPVNKFFSSTYYTKRATVKEAKNNSVLHYKPTRGGFFKNVGRALKFAFPELRKK